MTPKKPVALQSLVPCLTFQKNGEEAVRFYVSLFANSSIDQIVKTEAGGPLPPGRLLHAAFTLNGQPYTAMDGGESFTFGTGFSLVATCETQAELDAVWERLLEGGEESRCGWLTDRYGISWQVVPRALGQMLGNPKGGNAQKAMQAMLGMRKLDIAALEAAYKS